MQSFTVDIEEENHLHPPTVKLHNRDFGWVYSKPISLYFAH